MPLFTFTFGPDRAFRSHPIPARSDLKPAFHGTALPPALSDKARWLNFLQQAGDLLGFPQLKPLNPPAYGNEQRLTTSRCRT